MEVLERMPFKGRKAVFDRLEQMASKANMTVAERQQYEEEWKNWNDYYNTLDYAKKEGVDFFINCSVRFSESPTTVSNLPSYLSTNLLPKP